MIHNGRLAALMARKAQIEADLQSEITRRYPDQIRVTTLKRRKLLLKEELDQHMAQGVVQGSYATA